MKNIRRRVYDALNVLLAMNIITKNKKDIRWIGLPASASQEITRLEEEKARREASIKNKMEALQDMIMQIVAYKNLVEKNRKHEQYVCVLCKYQIKTVWILQWTRPSGPRFSSSSSVFDYQYRQRVSHSFICVWRNIFQSKCGVQCFMWQIRVPFFFRQALWNSRRFWSFKKYVKCFRKLKSAGEILEMKMACGLDTGTSTEEDVKKAKEFLPELHQHYIDEIVEGKRLLIVEATSGLFQDTNVPNTKKKNDENKHWTPNWV